MKPLINVLNVFIGIFLVAALVLLGNAVADHLDDYGGAGETCFPGDTCERGLTCFRFRDEHRCENKVEVVYAAELPACYEANGKQECFKTVTECQVHFARHLGESKGAVVGCGP